MQHIIYTILNNGTPIQPNERLDQIFPHLEEVGADYILSNSNRISRRGRRLIKTHLPFHMTPMSRDAKYIFVARNPKDCIVSFFHHTRGFPKHYDFEDGDFDVFFDLFCQGSVDFGDYFKTLRSWLDHKHDTNVFFVTYENILRDKRHVILQLADFIGGSIQEELLNDNEELMKKVLQHTSVEAMKQHPLRWCSERKMEHSPFIRSGKVGGWNELLTKWQEEKIDDLMRVHFTMEELIDLGDEYR
jgi:hypothetical protein